MTRCRVLEENHVLALSLTDYISDLHVSAFRSRVATNNLLCDVFMPRGDQEPFYPFTRGSGRDQSIIAFYYLGRITNHKITKLKLLLIVRYQTQCSIGPI